MMKEVPLLAFFWSWCLLSLYLQVCDWYFMLAVQLILPLWLPSLSKVLNSCCRMLVQVCPWSNTDYPAPQLSVATGNSASRCSSRSSPPLWRARSTHSPWHRNGCRWCNPLYLLLPLRKWSRARRPGVRLALKSTDYRISFLLLSFN